MLTSEPTNERQRLILKFYPIVQIIAQRLAKRLPDTVDTDELISVGMLGLIDAVDRFDPERGVPLKAYAEIRIKGAMLDVLRQNDWVPRSVRRKHQQIEQTRQALSQSLGRLPSRTELAAQLELSMKDFDRLARDSRLQRLLSLDAPIIQDGTPLIELVRGSSDDAETSMHTKEIHSAIDEAITELSEKERVALSMSYLEGYTLREIGGLLGVSESRVCQIRSRAVRRIRRHIQQLH